MFTSISSASKNVYVSMLQCFILKYTANPWTEVSVYPHIDKPANIILILGILVV
jgi:hypothetical protein